MGAPARLPLWRGTTSVSWGAVGGRRGRYRSDGTRVERQVRPVVIAAVDRWLPAQAALRMRVRCNAGFRPPHASRGVTSPVAIACLIAAISAAAWSWAIVTDSGGVEAHLSSTRPARAKRSGSRPTTTSTARPAAMSAAHSALQLPLFAV